MLLWLLHGHTDFNYETKIKSTWRWCRGLLILNIFSPNKFPPNLLGSSWFHIKWYQGILWKIHFYSWNFVRFSIPVTWNSTTEIAIGKVLPCNKKVMSLTPDRDNILKTWVHVVLNLMKCILQLIGLNKLKGQYAYLHTSTFSSQHFFFLRVQLYIVCMYIVFFNREDCGS